MQLLSDVKFYRPVTKNEFYAVIGPQNVHPKIISGYPYTSVWELPNRKIVGKTVDTVSNGRPFTDYFLTN